MEKTFKKILVANRGEIAVRIIRACHELSLAAVAVYSEADSGAYHARLADQAYPIGPAPAAESYLHIEEILKAARLAGADAIHPGYGFLAENPRFAAACRNSGMTFIGPSAAAMEILGHKISARLAAQRCGVPVVPGTVHSLASVSQAEMLAAQIGFPVMLKAAAGGGGKGLRRVDRAEDLPSALRQAQGEATSAFADGTVFLEKCILKPRHIEIQVLADEHGHVVYLGERECSIQRRNQKVIEEAPSPFVDDGLRRSMGEAAVRLAREAGYTNAGTMEFLVDRDKNFYFLEANTRLQVEHPVTELVTGLDLVKLQIGLAAGQPLPFAQSDVQLRGHAIECRIYAEDPENHFYPSPGRLLWLSEPSGPGIRLDSGVQAGDQISIHYDPLIAKLIAFGPTRGEALSRATRALKEYRVAGVKTTIPFFLRVLQHRRFVQADLDTAFIEDTGTAEPMPANGGHEAVAAVLAALSGTELSSSPPPTVRSSWKRTARWRPL